MRPVLSLLIRRMQENRKHLTGPLACPPGGRLSDFHAPLWGRWPSNGNSAVNDHLMILNVRVSFLQSSEIHCDIIPSLLTVSDENVRTEAPIKSGLLHFMCYPWGRRIDSALLSKLSIAIRKTRKRTSKPETLTTIPLTTISSVSQGTRCGDSLSLPLPSHNPPIESGNSIPLLS